MVNMFQMLCGTCNKPVVNPVLVKSNKLIAFIRKRNKEFRPEEEICRTCYNALVVSYTYKRKRALQLVKKRDTTAVSSTTETDVDAIDSLVKQTPLNPTLKSIVKHISITPRDPLSNLQQNRNDDSDTRLFELNSQNSATYVHHQLSDSSQSIDKELTTVQDVLITSVQSPLDIQPTTSAAAKRILEEKQKTKRVTIQTNENPNLKPSDTTKSVNVQPTQRQTTTLNVQPAKKTATKRKLKDRNEAKIVINHKSLQINTASETKRIRIIESSDPSDDDGISSDNEPSQNVLNGTRLPHVQPIVKGKPFQHSDPRVMDIYLAGTTGG